MFTYMSKRIAIPNGVQISDLGWNEEQGWLACGGSSGLLKVLKVDAITAQSQKGLSLNQTLEGHDAPVTIVTWNHMYRKLSSCDSSGRIIVWTLHKGMWFEEMVNNRNKSSVSAMRWNNEGTRICICYADGTVIMGGVDGNRLWGHELPYEIQCMCWSADDRHVLIGTAKSEVFAHDATNGHLVCQVNIVCREASDGPAPFAAMDWHPAWVDRPEPLATLAFAFADGKIQLMGTLGDERPYVIDCGTPVRAMAWNPDGTVLAVAGVAGGGVSGSDPLVVTQFFSHKGTHLRTLRVPGKSCGGVTWEGDGLRVAIGVESSIYFANVRPDYKYCVFDNTVVFSFNRNDRVEDTVMLWNYKTNVRTVKNLRNLIFLDSSQDCCVIVNKPEESQQSTMVQLVNSIGCAIDTRFVDLEPYACAMNSSHVVCCGDENIYVWRFRDPAVRVDAMDPVSVQANRRDSVVRVIHVDDFVRQETEPTMAIRSAITLDLICATCLSEQYLFVARESGLVQVYRLDPFHLVSKMLLPSRVSSMTANCDSTFLAVTDIAGLMNVYPIDKDRLSLVPRKAEPLPNMQRKDVWSVRWAADDPLLLAIMEKTRLYIFHNFEPEEPVQSCANLCGFSDLRVRAVQFDDLMGDPERPRKECVVEYDTKTRREVEEMMETQPSKEVYAYVDANPHPALWAMLAEHALTQRDFTYAEMAFIRLKDYAAIQFVKRVRALDDGKKQDAEVHAYYQRFDEAERIYKDMDRKDLALELRRRLGDWFGVVRLVQEGGGDETLMLEAWESIGDHYANSQKWNKAIQYYTQARCYEKLANAFYLIEDYEMLSQLTSMAEHDKDLLLDIARKLLTVGLAEDAAKAFVAAGEPQMAVDGCVSLNMWSKAIALAEEHRLESIEATLGKYARQLIRRERLSEAIELYRKAGQHDQAAKILAQLGQQAALTDALKAKKFYVLSALEVEKHRRSRLALGRDGTDVVRELLDTDTSSIAERSLDAAWRGAEAYHFFLACQQQILEKNLDTALVLAMRLMDYDELIAPVDSYSLIALTSYLLGNYGLCSKAFTRLEAAERNDEAGGGGAAAAALADFTMDLDVTQKTMSGTALGGGATMAGTAGASALSGTTTAMQLTNPAKGAAIAANTEFSYPTVAIEDPVRQFADLAVRIFTRHRPVDTSVDSAQCPGCGTFNKEWATACAKCQKVFDVCIVTGRCITAQDDVWVCPVCHRKAIDTEVDRYKNCPLCHSPKKQRLRRGL